MKMRFFTQSVINVIDVLFPSQCALCGAPISYHDDWVCDDCRSGIVPVEKACPKCAGIVSGGICTVCSDRRWYPDRSLVIAEYAGVIKEMLHAYKFGRRRRIFRHLAALALPVLAQSGLDFDCVTCVPASRKTHGERGFNQSELIARSVACSVHRRYVRILRERHGSAVQKKLHYRDRFLNIVGRYALLFGAGIDGKKVLIIDDVFTTGATINECARILKEYGAKSVYSLTIARVDIKNSLIA